MFSFLLPGLLDYVLILLYIFIIIIIAFRIQNKNIKSHPEYKYFVKGLIFKIIVVISFCLIYILYYDGGDTTGYFLSSKCLVNLFFKDSSAFFSILSGNLSLENYSYFDNSTGLPEYWRDPQAFTVIRITCIFSFIGFNNYITTSILISTFTYIGLWKLYRLFNELYPKLEKQFAISFLFVPSVVFWGSGVMKDTYTLMAACWFSVNFYNIFIKKNKIFGNSLLLIINSTILLSIKPYIFVALLPGSIIWSFYSLINKVQNSLVKKFIAPIFLIISLLLGIYSLSFFSRSLGEYSDYNKIITKAQITQQDFTHNKEYSENYFNIGPIEGSFTSLLEKFPIAVLSGLFRPFIWEAKNPVMLISGLENLIILIFFLYIIFKVGISKFFGISFKEPLVLFSLGFSIFFCFAVGLTTGNFGSLVRYRIPALPFFIASLFILNFCRIRLKSENH